MFGKFLQRKKRKNPLNNVPKKQAALLSRFDNKAPSKLSLVTDSNEKYSYIEIKVSKDKIQQDLVDFPLMITLSASAGLLSSDVSDIFNELENQYKKLKLYDCDGNQCYIEIETWEFSAKKAVLHAKVHLKAGIDNYFKLYYSKEYIDNFKYVSAVFEPAIQVCIDKGHHGTYDTAGAAIQTVIKESESYYRMWYRGYDGTAYRILFTESMDAGKTWAPATLCINIGFQGTYDTSKIYQCHVIKESNTSYKMWYAGNNGTTTVILSCTSIDGKNWVSPSIDVNNGFQAVYDTQGCSAPFVLKEHNTLYRMWYSAYNGTNTRIVHCTSIDGKNWNNPTLCTNINFQGVYDTAGVAAPKIIKISGTFYKMWYSGTTSSSDYKIIGCESYDGGYTWINPQLQITINKEGTYDTSYCHTLTPLLVEDYFKAWYTASDGTNERILTVISEDGKNWYTKPSNRVWDKNFKSVHHLCLNPLNTLYDSTYSNNKGTSEGSMAVTQTDTGSYKNGVVFDGTNDAFTMSSTDLTNVVTVEALLKTDTVISQAYPTIVCKASYESGHLGQWLFYIHKATMAVQCIILTPSTYFSVSSGTITTNTVYYSAFTYDTTKGCIFINGKLSNQTTSTEVGPLRQQTKPFTIGKRYNQTDGFFDGAIYEVRVSDIVRSNEWIKATNATLKDKLCELSLNKAPLNENYIEIIIDHTKIEEDIGGFPLMLNISSEAGLSKTDLTAVFNAPNEWESIEIFDDSGISCPVEVESWDKTNRRATLHVLVPYISSLTDTTLKLYYHKKKTQDSYITARTFIFDCKDNYGYSTYMSIRAIDFLDENGKKIPYSTSWSTGQTSYYSSSYPAVNSLKYTTAADRCGSWSGKAWVSVTGATTNQRLYVVFENVKKISAIIINNSSNGGGTTDAGVKNIKIYASIDAVVSTVYNKIFPNMQIVYDGIVKRHVDADRSDDYYINLTNITTTNIGLTGSYAAQKVWDKGYICVYHFAQDPSKGTDCIKDSTVNANHGTPYGTVLSEHLIDGYKSKALYFNGNTALTMKNALPGFPAGLTFEIFCKDPNEHLFTNEYYGLGYPSVYIHRNNFCVNPTNTAHSSSQYTYLPTDISQNTFCNVALLWDKKVSRSLYNGEIQSTALLQTTNLWVPTNKGTLSSYSPGDSHATYHINTFESFRISNIPRSKGWIKATALCLRDELLFFNKKNRVFEKEENIFTLKIDCTKIQENLYNFPITLYLNESSGNNNFNFCNILNNTNSYKNIALYQGNTPCYIEVETWGKESCFEITGPSSGKVSCTASTSAYGTNSQVPSHWAETRENNTAGTFCPSGTVATSFTLTYSFDKYYSFSKFRFSGSKTTSASYPRKGYNSLYGVLDDGTQILLSSDIGAYNNTIINEVDITSEYRFRTLKYVYAGSGSNWNEIGNVSFTIKNTTPIAVLHAKIPAIYSNTDTILTLKFSKNTINPYIDVTGTTAAQQVWDPNYKIVYHMNQNPEIGGSCITDSTANNNNGIPNGAMTLANIINGHKSTGLYFNGISNYIQSSNNVSISSGSVSTTEILFKYNSGIDIIAWGTLTDYSKIRLRSNTKVDAYNSYMQFLGDSTNFNYVAFGVAGTTVDSLFLYRNGNKAYSNANLSPSSVLSITDTALTIGTGLESGQAYLNGIVEEVRVSNIVRSEAWIKATNASLRDALIEYHGTKIKNNTVLKKYIPKNTVKHDVYDTVIDVLPVDLNALEYPDLFETNIPIDYVYEMTGQELIGTNTSLVWSPFGRAIKFPSGSTTSCINTGFIQSAISATTISLMYKTANTTSDQVIFDAEDSDGQGVGTRGLLSIQDNGKWFLGIDNEGYSYTSFNVDATLTPNTWHHLLLEIQGTVQKFYIDNILVQTWDSSKLLTIGTTPLVIGRPGLYATGFATTDREVALFKIYNRILSKNERQNLYEEASIWKYWDIKVGTTEVLQNTPAEIVFYDTAYESLQNITKAAHLKIKIPTIKNEQDTIIQIEKTNIKKHTTHIIDGSCEIPCIATCDTAAYTGYSLLSHWKNNTGNGYCALSYTAAYTITYTFEEYFQFTKFECAGDRSGNYYPVIGYNALYGVNDEGVEIKLADIGLSSNATASFTIDNTTKFKVLKYKHTGGTSSWNVISSVAFHAVVEYGIGPIKSKAAVLTYTSLNNSDIWDMTTCSDSFDTGLYVNNKIWAYEYPLTITQGNAKIDTRQCMLSRFKLNGDFDIECQWNFTTTTTSDYFFMDIIDENHNKVCSIYKENSTYGNKIIATNYTAYLGEVETYNSGYFKINRNSNTYTLYRKQNTEDSWNIRGQWSITNTINNHVNFKCEGAAIATLSYFKINSGSITPPTNKYACVWNATDLSSGIMKDSSGQCADLTTVGFSYTNLLYSKGLSRYIKTTGSPQKISGTINIPKNNKIYTAIAVAKEQKLIFGISTGTGAIFQTGVLSSSKYYWFTDGANSAYNQEASNFINNKFNIYSYSYNNGKIRINRNTETSDLFYFSTSGTNNATVFGIAYRNDNNSYIASEFSLVMYLNTLVSTEERKIYYKSATGSLLRSSDI